MSGDGVSLFTAEDGTPTDSWCMANIHPSGDCWMMDVSPESGNTRDSYEIKNRESERPTSASNKTHGQKERCLSVEGVWRQEIVGEELNGKWKQFHRTRGKSYISGIRRQALNAFAKRIAYRNFGAHSSIREIFDYIIESKLVAGHVHNCKGLNFCSIR
eukprot:TRINITY_DN10418_c0_g1_i1.p1 TRINITY_DN10418_c0_g1~~TRINITY_DN10418_c0_g1_i1.p1  ORF type:complete len:159 (-),score=8.05 TRINITY_DN10418_c0_g1_i1:66-542(-)